LQHNRPFRGLIIKFRHKKQVMKRTILILSVFPLLFSGTSCIKDTSCRNKTIESEQGQISSYASTTGMTGTTHSSGLYYQVLGSSIGVAPTNISRVSVTYTGKFLDGTVFDSSTTPITFGLGDGIIEGWRIGLPLIQKGQTIRMVIPSSLAYGCAGRGSISSNTILFFEVQLLDVL